MTPTSLHIFAINSENKVCHTHLTRAQGEAPVLPPLADWLGLAELDTGRIELFPVKDLEDVTLSDYVTAAFDPVPAVDAETRARLDALEGSVLLVPATAMVGAPSTGLHLSEIAALPLAEADHSATLPKATLQPPKPEQKPLPNAGTPERMGLSPTLKLAGLAVLLVLLFVWLVG